MKILLDTCIFLWYISSDDRLQEQHVDVIRDPKTEVFLSSVSVWEASIKNKLGRLSIPEDPGIYFPKQRIRHHILSLPLDEVSIRHLSGLPSIHKDPFDRILVCQAMEHDMMILTKDKHISSYPIKTL